MLRDNPLGWYSDCLKEMDGLKKTTTTTKNLTTMETTAQPSQPFLCKHACESLYFPSDYLLINMENLQRMIRKNKSDNTSSNVKVYLQTNPPERLKQKI